MIESEVWDAFATAVQAFADDLSPPVPVIHEGVAGTPPDTGFWLETRFFPNRTQNYALGNEGPTVHQGICQVTVCYRTGAGTVAGLELAGDLVDAFDKGTVIGPARVETKPYISSVIVQPDSIRHPITIQYVARP